MTLKQLIVLDVAIVTVALGSIYLGRTTAREADAHAQLTAALHVADTATAHSAQLLQRAKDAELRVVALGHRADSLEKVSRAARIKYVTVRDAAPDTCAELAEAADSALAVAEFENETLRGQISDLRTAAASYHSAFDVTDSALAGLRTAGQAVVAARPSRFARLIPHAGIGAAAGVNPATGRPSLTTGITFGWTF